MSIREMRVREVSVREVGVKEIKRLHTLAKLARLEKQRLVLIELLYKALESICQPLGSPGAICKSISCRFMDTRNSVSG
jgi:hypothetical protein